MQYASMNAILKCSAAVLALAGFTALSAPTDKIRVLVVSGGHDYQTNQFVQMFQDNPDITFTAVSHPKAQAWFAADQADRYDVLVFYDMWQDISPAARADLVARLEQGKGLVALHHGLGSYQAWDEYVQIIGGKYHLRKRVVDGVEKPGSTYKHDVRFRVQVAETPHPVTRGVKDFDILDETYGGLEVLPGVQVLLTTQERTSSRELAWAKTYRQARVVTLQLGHDHAAYENPNYRRLLSQAIRWVAKRD